MEPGRCPAIPDLHKDALRFAAKAAAEGLGDLTSTWQGQHDPLGCTPTCIKNILDDLRQRTQGKPAVKNLSVSQLNELCGRQAPRGMSKVAVPTSLGLDIIAAELSRRLADRRLRASHVEAAGWSALSNMVEDAQSSYPMVILGPTYFADEAVPVRASGQGDGFHHSCVVLAAGEKVVLFDPLLKNQHPSDHHKYLIRLPRPRFLEYWETTDYGTECMRVVPLERGLHGF